MRRIAALLYDALDRLAFAVERRVTLWRTGRPPQVHRAPQQQDASRPVSLAARRWAAVALLASIAVVGAVAVPPGKKPASNQGGPQAASGLDSPSVAARPVHRVEKPVAKSHARPAAKPHRRPRPHRKPRRRRERAHAPARPVVVSQPSVTPRVPAPRAPVAAPAPPRPQPAPRQPRHEIAFESSG
jgi:hypothetical protein